MRLVGVRISTFLGKELPTLILILLLNWGSLLVQESEMSEKKLCTLIMEDQKLKIVLSRGELEHIIVKQLNLTTCLNHSMKAPQYQSISQEIPRQKYFSSVAKRCLRGRWLRISSTIYKSELRLFMRVNVRLSKNWTQSDTCCWGDCLREIMSSLCSRRETELLTLRTSINEPISKMVVGVGSTASRLKSFVFRKLSTLLREQSQR